MKGSYIFFDAKQYRYICLRKVLFVIFLFNNKKT